MSNQESKWKALDVATEVFPYIQHNNIKITDIAEEIHQWLIKDDVKK